MNMDRLPSAFFVGRHRLRQTSKLGSFVAAALLALPALSLQPLSATALARMSVRELARQSTYVARVRCAQVTSQVEGNLVWTLTAFQVLDAWKGSPPPRFTVRLPGGEAAGLRVTVEGAPRFTVGEDVVLFLNADRGRQMNIVSWAQGTFRIQKNPRSGIVEAVQDTAGLQVLDTRSGASTLGGRRRIPLELLRASVREALQETAR